MFQPQDFNALLKQTVNPTLSLYLHIDPAVPENQSVNPAWRTWAKNTLRDLEKGVPAEEAAVWSDMRSRAERYLDASMPNGKGLALFYGQDFERIFELPVEVENNAAFGTPLLTPLLWIMDEYKPYLIAMVDHAQARFLITYLGQVNFQDAIELKVDTSDWRTKTNPVSVVGAGRGSATDVFQDRVEEHMSRHWHEVAEHIGRLMHEHHVRRVFIVGDEQAAHAVQNHLPETSAQAVVGVKALPMRYNPKEILQQILPMALEHERQREMTLVEQVVGTAKAGGRASVGLEAVLHSLEQQRVELLIAPWPMQDGNLAQELPFQVLASGGEVELVHGPAAERLAAEGGLAARLYYAPYTA